MKPSKYALAGVLAAISALGWSGAASAAGCPASVATPLGGATACLTITLNSNGTATVVDASPSTSQIFDIPQSEDTLIEVINNSGQTVNSLNLSSNLTIFAFDGDGTWANANGQLINYNGGTAAGVQTTTFSNIAGNEQSGTVNFTGGLATGGTTFFGLEEPVTAATFVVSRVPGPIVGAGLPGLIAGFGGLLGFWRRRRQQSA
jgi:hypothetical protein